MDVTFLFLMVALKVPIVMLGYIVWWAIRSTPDDVPQTSDGDGGIKRPRHPHRAPNRRPYSPRSPRRGPHGGCALPAPPRVRTRTVVAKARSTPRRAA